MAQIMVNFNEIASRGSSIASCNIIEKQQPEGPLTEDPSTKESHYEMVGFSLLKHPFRSSTLAEELI